MNISAAAERKSLLRREIIEARSRLSKTERDNKNMAICARLLEIQEFKGAGLIMVYKDFRNEVGTAAFIEECYNRGKRIALPVVADTGGAERELLALEALPEESFVTNHFGISEPNKDTAVRVSELDIDLVIVPGVAFDLMKHRIGYGAGYYDRFLNKLRPECRTVGIAYELQIVVGIPAEKHDYRLDMVITEHRVII